MRGDGGHRLVVAGVDAFRVGTVARTNGIAKAIDQRIRGDAGNADVMGRRYEGSCRLPSAQEGSLHYQKPLAARSYIAASATRAEGHLDWQGVSLRWPNPDPV
jgi:hypothetical protein